MELEKRYLRDVAHHLHEAKWDRSGHQSNIIARGIRESGLLHEMSSTRESIGRLTAMADLSFDAIVGELTVNNRMMSGLLNAVQNPKATAAAELYNRGVEALRNGWGPEAIRDLEDSVAPANNPYHAGAHFALGCAYTGEGRNPEAASAFSKAAQYSLGRTDYNPELACGAALLGSRAFLAARQPDGAKRLLREVHGRVPECPEVALAITRSSPNADAEVYRRALSTAPEFAAEVLSHDLRRGSVDTVEAVSDDLCFGRQGLSGQLERVRTGHEQLTKDLEELGGTVPAPLSTPALSTNARGEGPNAILLAGVGTAMNEEVPRLAALVDTVDNQLRQWISAQQGNLAPERARLSEKSGRYVDAKNNRMEFLSSVVYWSVGAIPFVALLLWFLELEETRSAADVTAGFIVIGGLWMLLGLALLIGLFVVVWRGFRALVTVAEFPVSSGERRRLDQRQTDIENKQREVEGHLDAARQALASWPPKRVVPFF